MSKVIVVGGGAAGMLAAIYAAQNGHEVTLLEKNEKLGKKIFITGKGRCNITNTCDMDAFFNNIVSNSKFLYSACYSYDSSSIISLLEEMHCRVKVERGERAFPVSDHSSDVIRALQDKLNELGVTICLNTKVKELDIKDDHICGVIFSQDEKLDADCVIVATGGMSYPLTGSDGDGYKFAKKAGHTITNLSPALVPLEVSEEWPKSLMGLSLKNVELKAEIGGKLIYKELGEMLFTHFGISGPLVLSASSYIAKKGAVDSSVIHIDLKPGLTHEQLDKRILKDFDENKNKQFKNALQKLFPVRLIPIMIELSGIDPEQKVNEISKEARLHFVSVIKDITLHVKKLRGYNEAIVTQGGITVKEVNPSTMESKLVKGLYFAGEVLDVDALTGGFNLQIAWSTGYLAGTSIGE